MSETILDLVRDELVAAGIVQTQAEFCESWLGRSECYMRTLRFNGLGPSAEVLATLGSRLGYYAYELGKRRDRESQNRAALLTEMRRRTQSVLEERVRERWQKVCSR